MGKIVIKTEKIDEMIKSVKHATDNTGLYLGEFNGIWLKADGKSEITMITCDGHRLFMNKCKVEKCTKFNVVIPVIKIPKDVAAITIIETRLDFVSFDFGNVKMTYRSHNPERFEKLEIDSFLKRENKFSICVNPNYLKDALKNMNNMIELKFGRSDTDGIIIQDCTNENEIKYVLPMRKNRYSY
ncbi:MAG: hypothetical protein IJ629_06150 [Clostridia bacterium]|nr:hypothetical protein [Clostridia bacterium]